MLEICDIFSTVLQSFLFVWISNNISSRNNKLSKFKFFVLVSILLVNSIIFTYSNINTPLSNFIMVLFCLFFIVIFYRKSILDAFTGFGMAYSIISLSLYFLSIFYQNISPKLNVKMPPELQVVLFIYIPMWIIFCLVYIFRKYIFDSVIYFKSLKHSLIFVLLIDFALIFMDTVHLEWTTENMGIVFKSILYLVAFVTFVFAIIYFANINNKSKEIEKLNMALNDKITELRKIKHDYGSEISSLYGLYQLGKIDRLGELLKNIVERNQSLNTSVSVNVQASPMVASILHSAVMAGINVIIFDNCTYENLPITDNELLKLLSNIIKNSIDVLENVENPIIKYKSYNSYDGIIITIINNGPEIPKEIRDRIFESGFSTKDNMNGDRGYGLSIVKDIINECNGKIYVESNTNATQFKIEIPYITS